MSLEQSGLLVGIISTIVAIAYFVIKAFIRQAEKGNIVSATIANIYKENSEKHLANSEKMIEVIHKNNNSIDNNTKSFERLEGAIVDLKDITMQALIKSRQ